MKKISRLIIYTLALFAIVVGVINYIDPIRTTAYPVYREIEKYRMVNRSKEFYSYETHNFIIRYTEQDKDLIEDIGILAESAYIEVGQNFGYFPDKKTYIFIYPTRGELKKSLALEEGQGAMGVYYGDTISLLSPIEWMDSLDNFLSNYWYYGPIVHEYAHLITDRIAKSNYPLWFTEGISLYQEEVVTGYRWGEWIEWEMEPYSIRELNNNFNGLDEIMAYKRSYEIVGYMAQQYGFDSIIKILEELGRGTRFDTAIERVIGVDLATLELRMMN